MEIGRIIEARRKKLGIDQEPLAALVGVTARQIRRYESGDQEPTASVCDRLAGALNLTLGELFGKVPIGLDLSGEWFATWQTSRGGVPVIDRHGLIASHAGDRLALSATGDYLWSADLDLFDSSLMGTYRSTERDRQFRGTLYFDLADDAHAMMGRWSGRWADGVLGKYGFGVIARDSDRADRLLDWLIHHPGPITAWPQEDNPA